MSSLLEQALIDAKALREAALKNAEASIIEKYSEEVRSTLDNLLEQDEMGLGMPAPGAEAAPAAGDAEEEVLVSDEAASEAADADAMADAGLEEDKKPDGDGDGVPPWADKDDNDEDVQEEALDSLVAAIAEKLTVDMGADLTGWAGRRSEDTKHAMEKEIAHRRSTELQDDLEALRKAQEELVFENNQLKEQNQNYEEVVEQLKETVVDVNLSNARLLYTNRVLRNTSLNERQKNKIVEAISGAGSVTEAKLIFETLQSTVETKPKRSPQSLSEAIGRNRASVIRATRKESTTSDPISDRMKKLAGIK
jgi:FtsZ-binding cell division protein ZapB